MILIISNNFDISTHKVTDYLIKNRKDFFIINENDFIEYASIVISDSSTTIELTTPKGKISSDSISSVWYRRGKIDRKITILANDSNASIKHKHLISEWQYTKEFIHDFFEQMNGIGSYRKATYTKKLQNLFVASTIGFNIPTTLISNKKQKLLDFLTHNKFVITKSIERDLNYSDAKKSFGVFGTQVVTENMVKELDAEPHIFHSFLQKGIEKEFEIRAFYIKEQIWAMAIFSQRDIQTQLDYRAYNLEKPNRMIPYQFTEIEKTRIISFMQAVKMDTGSIDFIVDKKGKLIFLEVNPVGQYDFVSENCNYYLDKVIAENLV